MLPFFFAISGTSSEIDLIVGPKSLSVNFGEGQELAKGEKDSTRRKELENIARVCSNVPANAPTDLWEALQMYWFLHVGVISELNGWSCLSPGHLDRHLYPFFEEASKEDRQFVEELLCCFWLKFDNHPAPPKFGATAQESGTYNDFVNFNVGGITANGEDASNELTYLFLDIADAIALTQPQCNVQLSRVTPEPLLLKACKIIGHGHGFPAMFNCDGVVTQALKRGISLKDAREGGIVGCVETVAFGKESASPVGYLSGPKIMEITLYNGFDPRTDKQLGPKTGEPESFNTFDELMCAFRTQMQFFVDLMASQNDYVERQFAKQLPQPFLSVLVSDCIAKGKDYNDGGPRYNSTFIEAVGIGTVTDSFAAIKKHVFDDSLYSLRELRDALSSNFKNKIMRDILSNKTPRYGNDDNFADDIMQQVFDVYVGSVEGRPNTRGGFWHMNLLPTTTHIFLGSKVGATPDGRLAGTPLSEGISPVQGADINGPTAMIKSVAKMDHTRTGGTLLNLKFSPDIFDSDEGIKKFASLIRTYFRYGGHHMQFNVIDTETLRDAQKHPEDYRDLLVRVAGFSDYFCALDRDLQEEIIKRHTHSSN